MRKLLFLSALAGIAVAIKKALEDKGGSFDVPAAASSSSAPVPTPPVPTFEVPQERPVENLDEFADPVEPPVKAEPVPAEPEPAPAAAEPERPARTQPPTAAAVLSDARTKEQAPVADEPKPAGKIDPFGIRG